MMNKDLEIGTVLYKREFNIYRHEFDWEFRTIKNITKTGKIRLDNGVLLNSLGYFKVFSDEGRKLLIEDKIKKNVKNIIYYLSSNKDNAINELPIEDVIKLGNAIKDASIENTKRWSNATGKESYENTINCFNKNKKDYSEVSKNEL